MTLGPDGLALLHYSRQHRQRGIAHSIHNTIRATSLHMHLPAAPLYPRRRRLPKRPSVCNKTPGPRLAFRTKPVLDPGQPLAPWSRSTRSFNRLGIAIPNTPPPVFPPQALSLGGFLSISSCPDGLGDCYSSIKSSAGRQRRQRLPAGRSDHMGIRRAGMR